MSDTPPARARIKVLHVVRPANLTGAPAAVLQLTRELAAALPADPTVFCGRGAALPEALKRAGVAVRVCPQLVRRPSPLNDLRALLGLLRYLQHERFDVVHTHSSKSGVLGRWAARLTGVPAIVHTAHGIPWAGSLLYQAIETLTGRVTDRLVALSDADRARLARLRLASEAAIQVIPNGLPLAEIELGCTADLRRELGLPASAPLVGTAGRQRPPKRPDLFVRMAAAVLEEIPDCHFVVAGDGPLIESSRTLAERLTIAERVHFLGWRDDLRALLPSLDLMALCSEWEGQPLVLIEAALLGVPIIASDVVGCRDLVTHGETGLLAPLEPRQLAAAALRLLTEPGLADRLAAAARRAAEERFDVRTTARATYEMYAKILRRKGRLPAAV